MRRRRNSGDIEDDGHDRNTTEDISTDGKEDYEEREQQAHGRAAVHWTR